MGIRIHEASKKYNLSNKDMADLLAALGYKGKTNPLAGLPDEMQEVLEKHFAEIGRASCRERVLRLV